MLFCSDATFCAKPAHPLCHGLAFGYHYIVIEGRCISSCNDAFYTKKDATKVRAVCEACAERDRFIRRFWSGGFLIEGIHAMQKWGGFVCLFLRRYAFLLCGGLILLLALLILHLLPKWPFPLGDFLRACRPVSRDLPAVQL